jgi:hypothetical protein
MDEEKKPPLPKSDEPQKTVERNVNDLGEERSSVRLYDLVVIHYSGRTLFNRRFEWSLVDREVSTAILTGIKKFAKK